MTVVAKFGSSPSAAASSLRVSKAPGALDTLNELAAALGDDPNFATTVTNQIATKAYASALINNAAAWSSGAVGDGYHYLDTGTNALVIRTNGGQISANFLGNAGGVPSDEGKVLFYKGVQVFGDLVVGGVNVEDTLALKADQGTAYSKTEVDASLALKADLATTYNKTEVDASLALKADLATTYNKAGGRR